MKKFLTTFLAAALGIIAYAQTGPDVLIPKPVSAVLLSGEVGVDIPVKNVRASGKFKKAVTCRNMPAARPTSLPFPAARLRLRRFQR